MKNEKGKIMSEHSDTEKLLTIKQLCQEYPCISKSMLYQWTESRELTHYRLGGRGRRGRIVIDESDFIAFLASRRIEADDLPTGVSLPHLQ